MCIIPVILGKNVVCSQGKLISNSPNDMISSNFSEKVDQDEAVFYFKDIIHFRSRNDPNTTHTPKIMGISAWYCTLNILTLSLWSNLRFPQLDSQRIQRYDHNNLLTKFSLLISVSLICYPIDHYLI
jgi:hypothetical protein